MPKRTHEMQSFRLSSEAFRIMDEISEELGGCSRRVAMELLARAARVTKEATGHSYSTLLLGDGPFQPELYDRRRRKLRAISQD